MEIFSFHAPLFGRQLMRSNLRFSALLRKRARIAPHPGAET